MKFRFLMALAGGCCALPTYATATVAAQPPTRSAVPATDSAQTRMRLAQQITAFHASWHLLWRQSELQRANDFNAQSYQLARHTLIHCHTGTEPEDRLVTTFWPGADGSTVDINFRYAQIFSGRSSFAVCPTWTIVEKGNTALDERLGRDGALLERLRKGTHDLRAKLLAQLDTAGAKYPGDAWIVGQRVRFEVDQRNFARAVAAATGCRADIWWCAALRGFAHASGGSARQADIAFEEMRQEMPTPRRCEWEDMRALLPAVARKDYEALTCADRESINERLWWLATPLYRNSGNARLRAHYHRHVEIALHRTMARDERYWWGDAYGGDALAATVLRYGWPDYTAWGGDSVDVDHTDYLQVRKSLPAAPYTTFEYSADRVTTMPNWMTVAKPFEAVESSWLLSFDDAIGRPFTTWWPEELFRPERRLVQFGEGQNVMLRRENRILVAAAVPFMHPLIGASVRTFDVLMLASPGPSRVDTAGHRNTAGGSTVVVKGLIASAPAIVSIEAQGLGSSLIDARTRFGVNPPQALSAMAAGDIAMSDPVLIEADAGELGSRKASEALLDRMLGTVRLGTLNRRVGVYWETYGIAANDTVTISVRVGTDQELGAMRRLGMALNVAENPNRAIVQRWTEPDAQRGTSTTPGRVSVQSRAIVLNLGLLQPDSYVLEISVERRDGRIVTGRRRVVVEQ
ncbi:MAG: hypothetical protein H7Z40_22665 [Phycisphaerae bacterium]|nr:hypothetical protein [Gemmatimonadaceae bacterium]